MKLNVFIQGIILGFSIAAPVGPIAVLCIRKTLQYGRLSGFASGLGAAVADALYGVIAALGLTFVSDFMLAKQFWLRLIGGAFLIYLGIRTFYAKPKRQMHPISHNSLISDFISTFFLTLTNPLTILSYLAIFAALGLTQHLIKNSQAAELVLGVFVGSSAWWLILSEGVTFFRKKVSDSVMLWINRIAGATIIVFGCIAWISLAF